MSFRNIYTDVCDNRSLTYRSLYTTLLHVNLNIIFASRDLSASFQPSSYLVDVSYIKEGGILKRLPNVKQCYI